MRSGGKNRGEQGEQGKSIRKLGKRIRQRVVTEKCQEVKKEDSRGGARGWKWTELRSSTWQSDSKSIWKREVKGRKVVRKERLDEKKWAEVKERTSGVEW